MALEYTISKAAGIKVCYYYNLFSLLLPAKNTQDRLKYNFNSEFHLFYKRILQENSETHFAEYIQNIFSTEFNYLHWWELNWQQEEKEIILLHTLVMSVLYGGVHKFSFFMSNRKLAFYLINQIVLYTVKAQQNQVHNLLRMPISI